MSELTVHVGRVNKAAVIREYLLKKPQLKPREVAAAMKRRGIDVKPAYVSQIKTKISCKGRRRTRLARWFAFALAALRAA